MSNQVVVHYANGDIIKGKTEDFFPNKSVFHLQEKISGEMKQINIQDLKAVYFVNSFEGNPQLSEKTDVERSGFGRKIKVHFKDGEVQYGYTQGYAPNRPGFFVSPCDKESNNIRIFVVSGATEKADFV